MDFGFAFEAESVKWKGVQLGFTKRMFRYGIARAEVECCISQSWMWRTTGKPVNLLGLEV
jgi:hypothetical protein